MRSRPSLGSAFRLAVLAVSGCNGGGSSSGGSNHGAASTVTSTGGTSPGSTASTSSSTVIVSGTGSGGSTLGGPGKTVGTGTRTGSGTGTGTGTGSGSGTGTGTGSGTPAPGTWTAGPNMSMARTYASAAVTDSGQIYVMGGADSISGTPTTLNEVYDPATNTITVMAALPVPRWQHGAAYVGGQIYLVGGSSQTAFDMLFGQPDQTEVDVYDVATDSWTTTTPLTTARHDMSAVTINGQVLALSGVETTSTGGAQYLETDLLDATSGTWSSGPGCPSPISSTAALCGANIFVANPAIGGTAPSATLYETSSTAQPFAAVTGSFALSYESRAVAMNGRVYVIGGIDPASQTTVSTVQSFDGTQTAPTTQLYQHTGLNTDRCRSAVAAWNGQIFVFGGDQQVIVPGLIAPTPSSTALASIEIYTP